MSVFWQVPQSGLELSFLICKNGWVIVSLKIALSIKENNISKIKVITTLLLLLLFLLPSLLLILHLEGGQYVPLHSFICAINKKE